MSCNQKIGLLETTKRFCSFQRRLASCQHASVNIQSQNTESPPHEDDSVLLFHVRLDIQINCSCCVAPNSNNIFRPFKNRGGTLADAVAAGPASSPSAGSKTGTVTDRKRQTSLLRERGCSCNVFSIGLG